MKLDSKLRHKLQYATDLDAFVSLAGDAGFAVEKADILRTTAGVELSDDELEEFGGGMSPTVIIPTLITTTVGTVSSWFRC
jgi:predicted ribosomally synthesized peptide with nif11-like leader